MRSTSLALAALAGACLMPCGMAGADGAAPPHPEAASFHPAFVITPSKAQEMATWGRDLARRGKKSDDLYDGYIKQAKWTRGRSGSANTKVCFLSLNAFPVAEDAFQAERLYREPSVPKGVIEHGGVIQELRFIVNMLSTPKQARWKFQKSRGANQADVVVDRFVLSDDQGHNWEVAVLDTNAAVGYQTFSGATAVPHVSHTDASSSSTASAVGSGGWATGTEQTTATQDTVSYTYVPWSAQAPYYSATYRLEFALMDGDGKSRVPPTVKNLTLHMITADGEQSVSFDLNGRPGHW